MNRKPLNKKRSRNMFTRNAKRVHPKNFNMYARGGIRL